MTKFEVDDHFRRWWDEDWSWEGLAKKKWHGGNQGSTIQDYWLKEKRKGRLVDFAGRRWTRFHLPLHDLDGKLSDKATWTYKDFQDFSTAIIRLLLERADELRPLSREEHLTMETSVPFNGLVFPASFDFSAARDALFADFSSARFSDNINFTAANFPYKAKFRNAAFGRGANFINAKFQDAADFDDTVFGPFANFATAYFQSTARFIRATFSFETSFAEARFYNSANFSWTTFGHTASFESALFSNAASFSAAMFSPGANFDNAIFRGHADFERAKFLGLAVFDMRIDREESVPSFQIAVFRDAIFKGPVSFENRLFGSTTSFENAEFFSLTTFHGANLHQNTDFNGAKFLGEKNLSRKALELDYEPDVQVMSVLDRYWFKRHRRTQYIDFHAAALERAYRTLKLEMEENRSRHDEAKFFAHEQESRRLRSDVPLFERLLAFLYKWTCSYGESISAPAISWLITQTFFGVSYWVVSAFLTSPNDGALTRFVMEQNVRPFSIWTTRFRETVNKDESWVTQILQEEPFPFLELLASLQSITSLSLIFLFLLAIRRRFRMN